MISIGIAEDDPKIAQLLMAALTENGYEAVAIGNGLEALEAFQQAAFDLFIIDVLMPGLNGMQLVSNIRKNGIKTPVLMLTAMGMIDDKVAGFNAGADDYLVKPFHLKELLVRVKALVRRNIPSTVVPADVLTYEDIEMNTSSFEVYRNGIPIHLTAKEFTLLELFLRNPKKVLSRQYITQQVWDINFDTETNVIDVYINFLRKKIDKNFDKKLIHTKINRGFILQ